MKFLLLVLAFLLPQLTFSQTHHPMSSASTLVFQLTDKQAVEIYEQPNKDFELKESYLQNLVDSFQLKMEADLPVGHYLLVNARGEDVVFQLESVNSLQVKLFNNSRDFQLQVVDSLGQFVHDATVVLNNKNVPFDKKTQTYRLKKWNKEGLLMVKTADEILFQQVEKDINGSIFIRKIKRFSRTKFGRIVTAPVRIPVNIGKRVFYYFRNGFRYNNWQLRHLVRFFKKDKSYRGYMAFNKPKYQPLDTVKIKAYVTNHKGKPIKKALQLAIKERYSKTIFTKTIEPTSPGNFTYEFVLSDSLKLDKRYSVYFQNPKNDNQYLDNQFYYEDYQLDEVDFAFRHDQKTYEKEEKIILFAEGKDKNGQTIPDGEIRLHLRRGSVSQYLVDEVVIADTLWTHQQALDPRGETQIVVPDSIFPQVNLSVNGQAVVSNANGESKKFNINFTRNATTGKLEFRVENDTLIAAYREGGRVVSSTATLLQKRSHQDKKPITTEVQLPFKTKVNPLIHSYLLKKEDADEKITPQRIPSKIQVETECTADSIFIYFENPYQLDLHYLIQTKNKEIARGQTDSTGFLYQIADRSQTTYYVKWNYIWAGQSKSDSKEIRTYKNLLNIEIDQPKTIEPGENVAVKLTVKDYKNKPAKNVNLAAGAINAQFKKNNNLRAPDVEYKRKRKPFVYNTFKLKKVKPKVATQPVSDRWEAAFGLDSLLYYCLLRPENGVYAQFDSITSDTFYQHIAQFAPYLVKDGKRQPIYLIYCNRKLVYWRGMSNSIPYSFIGREGKNVISVRGLEREYTVKDIYLEKGKKLEFSIDVDHFNQSNYSTSQRFYGKKLTQQEQNLIKKTTFTFKHRKKEAAAIWQNNRIFLLTAQYNNQQLTPFYQSKTDSITYRSKSGIDNTFFYEAGFRYSIGENRERLYATDMKDYFRDKNLDITFNGGFNKSPGQVVPSFSDVEEHLKPPRKSFPFQNLKTQKNTGTFAWQLPTDSFYQAMVLVKNDTTQLFFRPNTRMISNLTSGSYDFYAFTDSTFYILKKVTVRQDSLYFINLENEPFQKDENQAILKNLVYKYNQFSKNKTKAAVEDLLTFVPKIKGGNAVLEGTVSEADTGDPVIYGSVALYQNGLLITGTETDFDGNYSFNLPAGRYDVEVSYVGFPSKRISDFWVYAKRRNMLNIELNSGINLEEVVVVGYGVAAKRSNSVTLNSANIRRRPVRGVNSLAAKSAGIRISDNDDQLEIRGSRSNATNYYLDGLRISGRDNAGNPTNRNFLRDAFADYAFWQPNLMTDANGEAYFQATYPDNITAWKTFVVGMDDKKRGGTQFAETRAFKKLMGQLALPRFLVEGDQTEIIGKAINYTNDTFAIQTTFKMGTTILQNKPHQLAEAVIEKLPITAPAPMDSLKLSYGLTTDTYGDGEARSIPVLPVGTLEAAGDFFLLEGDTTVRFSPKFKDLPIEIYVMDDALDLVLKDLDYLKNYPYGCNEQTASRLMALLMEKEIRATLQQPFEHEAKIIKAIGRLKKTQNGNGNWGWWDNGVYNNWMTLYVLKALQKAADAGYYTEALERGLRFVSNRVKNFSGQALVNTLELLATVEQNIDYQKLTNQLDTTKLSLHDQFSLIKTKQLAGLEYSLDTLFKYQKETTFGGLYWGESRYDFYNSSVPLTVLAYEIFDHAGRQDICKKIRQYFLQSANRTTRGNGRQPLLGRNTYETARVLSTILPDLLQQQGLTNYAPSLVLPNQEIVRDFPYAFTFENNDATTPLLFEKSGRGDLYLSVSQTFFNKNPQPKADLFDVKTTFLQNKQTVSSANLKKATDTQLVVMVEVKKSAEYLMVEVPIPAGCSYGQKIKRNGRYEVHREYFKDKVAIFCEALPVGTHEFRVHLEPRFSGDFTVNPVRVEQMYFPVFYGRNGVGKVEVE